MAGCLCFLLFAADSLGRRGSLLWTSAAQAVVMFIVGIYGRVQPPIEGNPVSPGCGPFLFATLLTLRVDYWIWNLRHGLHLPLGRVLPVRMGTVLLDSRQVCWTNVCEG